MLFKDSLSAGYSLYYLLKRPEVKIIDYLRGNLIKDYDKDVLEQAEFLLSMKVILIRNIRKLISY